MRTVSAMRWRRACVGLVCGLLAVSGGSAALAADRIFAGAFELPPLAAFDQSALGFEVTFADRSTDPVGTVGAWSWDFGDGSTATDQNPVHTYAAAGTYTVAETVFDATNGESGVLSKAVTVVPCGTLTAYLHDFKFNGTPGGHPDFENYLSGRVTGLVVPTITPGGLPSLQAVGSPQAITSAASFAQWFVDDPINVPVQQTLTLVQTTPGTYSYSTNLYFPLDGLGFGDTAIGPDNQPHNYSFTTMLHTQFRYTGGETFQFTGDDDVWVYVNGTLAIDLGGVHGAASASLTLNAPQAAALGMTPGQVYRLDFFQAERHTLASDFTLSTTLCLSDAH